MALVRSQVLPEDRRNVLDGISSRLMKPNIWDASVGFLDEASVAGQVSFDIADSIFGTSSTANQSHASFIILLSVVCPE